MKTLWIILACLILCYSLPASALTCYGTDVTRVTANDGSWSEANNNIAVKFDPAEWEAAGYKFDRLRNYGPVNPNSYWEIHIDPNLHAGNRARPDSPYPGVKIDPDDPTKAWMPLAVRVAYNPHSYGSDEYWHLRMPPGSVMPCVSGGSGGRSPPSSSSSSSASEPAATTPPVATTPPPPVSVQVNPGRTNTGSTAVSTAGTIPKTTMRVQGHRAKSIASEWCNSLEFEWAQPNSLALRLESAQSFDLCLYPNDDTWTAQPYYQSCGNDGLTPTDPGEITQLEFSGYMACIVPNDRAPGDWVYSAIATTELTEAPQ